MPGDRVGAELRHFRLAADGVTIAPLTPIGRVTVRILGLNLNDRLLERTELREIGRYPPEGAARLLATQPPLL